MDYAAATHVGYIRRQNEDNHLLPRVGACKGLTQLRLRKRGSLFIVCDGVGGANAGEVASDLATRELARLYYTQRHTEHDPYLLLPHLLHLVHDAVCAHSAEHRELNGMATTCVCVLLQEGTATFASVGDSRGYVLAGGSLRQVTEDHAPVWDFYRQGLITKEEARTHPRSNVIRAALGFRKQLLVDCHQLPHAPGAMYLLCSDGLSDMVPEPVMERIAVASANARECCDALVQEALQRGGHDNITVVCARP